MGRFSAVALLVLQLGALFCSFKSVEAYSNGGYLQFIDLSKVPDNNRYTVKRGSNTYGNFSSSGFVFGDNLLLFSTVYVSTNGYISLSDPPLPDPLPNFPLSFSYVVAPFANNIDTTSSGSVIYTDFMAFPSGDPQMVRVEDFIVAHTNLKHFKGTQMMVAEWNNVPLHGGSTSIVNKFQAILLQDGFKSYVVFIYDCETMKWGGGVIGWQAGIYDYEAHPLSGQTDSNTIGCLYSNKQSAVIYRVSACNGDEFICKSKRCVEGHNLCDGTDDCGDNEDEDDCDLVNVVAAAAGSALAFFIVATITAVCCCIVCCVRRARVRRRAHIHVTAVSTVPYVSLATVPPTQIAPVTTPESYMVVPKGMMMNPVPGRSPSPQPPFVTGQTYPGGPM